MTLSQKSAEKFRKYLAEVVFFFSSAERQSVLSEFDQMLAEMRKSVEGQRKDPKLFLQGEDQVIVRTWNQALDWFLSELLGTTEEVKQK